MSENTNDTGAEQVVTAETTDAEATKASEDVNTNVGDKFTTNLSELLGDDFHNDKTFKDFKGVDDLAKAYKEASAKLGNDANKIRLPEGEDDTEALEAIYDKLGRPESPDGYKFNDFEPPEEIAGYFDKESSDSTTEWFKNVAHELGLNNKQASALRDKYNNMLIEQATAMHEASTNAGKANKEALEQEWGNDYKGNKEMAKRAMEHFDPKGEFAEFLKATGNQDNPIVLRHYYNIGKQAIEDNSIGGRGAGNYIKTDAENARATLHAMRTDKTHPDYEALFNARHPRHKEVVEKKDRLARMLVDNG